MNNIKKEYESFFKIIEKYELEDLIKFSKTVRVLYVDSDESVKNDFYGIFKIFFHHIDIASNGKEGLELFLNNKYDLIITKLDMPQMNGVEMITEIREISRHITILALSSEPKYFIELIKLGIDGYILKPIDAKQFTDIIKKVIEKLQNKQGLYEYRINLEKLIEKKTQELKRLNNSLEHRIQEEVIKNAEKENQINQQARLASMGEMIANIAHQWRQPLSVISTSASGIQIKKEMGILEDSVHDQLLNGIINSSEHLSNTIDVFMDFIKEEKVSKEVILQERVNKAIEVVESSLNNNFIKVINNVDYENPVKLNLVMGELVQVIINILNNAKDVLVERNIGNPWIKIDLEKKVENVIITIEDNAGGIPDDVVPRIFDPYFTTKHKSHGTGLGLYMSHKIINESLKGKLYAQNTQNGARFCIKLPLNAG